ncbi:ABC transporter permease [candidate division KSB1 bacterium]|nr:ABC transporter permease [candidate division KSB1 bacterium]
MKNLRMPVTPVDAKPAVQRRFRQLLRQYGIIIAFLLECLFFAVRSEYFLTVPNILNVVNQIAIYGMIAVGMTFIIITGGIDLSVGSVVALVGVVTALVLRMEALPSLVLASVAILVGLLIGFLNGVLSGWVITRFNLAPFIITLAMMTICRGGAMLLSNGLSIGNLPREVAWLGRGHLGIIPMPVIIMLLVFGVGHVLLTQTGFGRYVYAIGGNEEATRLSGVQTRRVKFLVYVFAGCLTALSGVVLASRLGAGVPNSGLMYELYVIASVVVGGTSLSGGSGRISGTFFGVMIIGVLYNGLNLLNVSSYWQQVILGLVIVTAVLLDNYLKRNQK